MKHHVLFLIGFFLVLGGCTAPLFEPFKLTAYRQETPIYLNVSAVRVESQMMSYDRLPHIESQMPITPETALTDWAHERLIVSDLNTSVQALFIIQKADMTQTKKETTAWYTFDNMAYTLTFEAELILKQNEDILFTQKVKGMEMRAIPHKSSLSAKEKVWQEMMDTMLVKIHRKINMDLPKQFLK